MAVSIKIRPTEVEGVFRYRTRTARASYDGRVNGVIRFKSGPKVLPAAPQPTQIKVNFNSSQQVSIVPAEVPGRVTPLALRGPIGPEGPPGPPGSGSVSQFPSRGVLSGLRLVVDSGLGVQAANEAVPEHGLQLLGISLQSALNPGDMIQVQQTGSLTDPSFRFTPGGLVYATVGGILTQTPPAGPARAWQTIVGHATAEDTLFINIRDTVFLC